MRQLIWHEEYAKAGVDELFVQIGSVTLGAGKPLLPRAIVTPPNSTSWPTTTSGTPIYGVTAPCRIPASGWGWNG